MDGRDDHHAAVHRLVHQVRRPVQRRRQRRVQRHEHGHEVRRVCRTGPSRPWPTARCTWPRTLCTWRRPGGVAAASSAASWTSRKAFSEHLASITNRPPPGRRTVTSGRRRPSSVSVGGLFVEVEAAGQARGLQHVAQGLLAPAALDAGAPPQGRRTACAPRPGWRSRPAASGAICSFSPPVSSARAFSTAVTCSWNFSQGLGHRLQLGLQPRLGQLLAVAHRLVVLAQDLLGDAGRRLGELGADHLALLLQHADPRLGGGGAQHAPSGPMAIAAAATRARTTARISRPFMLRS